MAEFTMKRIDSPMMARPLKYNVATGKLAIDQTPLRARPATAGLFARVRDAHLPIDVSNYQRQGPIVEHLMSVLYNKIHVRPVSLILGNVVSTQQRDIRVWNAYFQAHSLESMELTDSEGIEISGQPEPPLAYGPLAERTYTVTVSTDGPPVVDANIKWQFDVQSLSVPITGSRITIWSFSPNWDGGILERLEWMTSVVTGPLGTEQRRSLRIAPRRSFQINLIANKRERAYMELSCFNWGARNWAIPVWIDVQELSSDVKAGDLTIPAVTDGRDFRVGGLLTLRGATAFDYEAREIASFDATSITLDRPLLNDWPKGTKLYPVRTARLVEQPTMTRLTDEAISAKAQFMLMEPSDWGKNWPADSYRGYPILKQPPEESDDLTNTYARLLQIVDNNSGLPLYVDTASLGFTAQAHKWQMHGRDQHTLWRSFFYYMAGQWRSVWVPTFAADLVPVDRAIAGNTTIDVEWVGYSRFGVGQPARRDIMITMKDGTQLFTRILDAQELTESTERLSLEAAWGKTYEASDFLRISYMAWCRLDQDFIEIQHETDIEGLSTAKAVFRSLRDDIEGTP